MLTRRLGRTGQESSLAILGGIAFHYVDEDTAGQLLHDALDAGVNHLDIAPGYLSAEQKIGPHLPAVRDRLFLSEKSGETTKDGVRRELEQTLLRLHVDSVDLYQLHGVTSVADLDQRAGAVEALLGAREQGLCRWLGITGHNVETAVAQLEALRRYDLDTVMLPVYPALWNDETYRTAAQALITEAVARDVGVMVIKAGAARPWTEPSSERSATTWYEPQSTQHGLELGVRFALSTPGVTAFCTPGDPQLLPIAVAAARSYVSLSDDERAAAQHATSGDPLIFPIPV